MPAAPRPLRLAAVLSLALIVTGCGVAKRLNPFTWFGQDREEAVLVLPEEEEDRRALVARVTDLRIEAIPGGAIVRATGLPPTQGWWEAELVPRPVDEAGRLVFDFRILPPVARTEAGPDRSREVVVARYLSDIALAEVREIVVQGQENARAVRR
jgi:hypothetical protein